MIQRIVDHLLDPKSSSQVVEPSYQTTGGGYEINGEPHTYAMDSNGTDFMLPLDMDWFNAVDWTQGSWLDSVDWNFSESL